MLMPFVPSLLPSCEVWNLLSPVSLKDAYPQVPFPKPVFKFFPNERLIDWQLIRFIYSCTSMEHAKFQEKSGKEGSNY